MSTSLQQQQARARGRLMTNGQQATVQPQSGVTGETMYSRSVEPIAYQDSVRPKYASTETLCNANRLKYMNSSSDD